MKRLHTRIYLHFVGVLLVVALASGAVFATGWRRATLRGSTERVARHVAGEVADRWNDAEATQRFLQRLSDHLDMDVTLRDADGAVRTVAGRTLSPLRPDEAAAVRDGTALWLNARWTAAVPIWRDGRFVGILEAAPRRPMHYPMLLRPMLNLVLVLLIVAVATAPLARRISRPVEQLTEASRRFGAGELSERVEWSGRRHPHGPPSELEELTAAWNDMADRIEGLVRGQKELLANVSHELRSPLARIRVALELLPDEGEARARVEDVKTDLAELERLIDDVLTTSRLEATGLPAHLESVDVRALLAQLAERAQHDPVVAGRAVRVAPGAPLTLVADGALLKRALWNLVENAAKYGAPPITLAAEPRDGGAVALTVTDEGPGIAAADRERVFDPFYRADRARTPQGDRGFGLGLTLARRVAEVHGGRITISDGAAGRGCAITLEVPPSGA
jgi:signal transduction histidine kinase